MLSVEEARAAMLARAGVLGSETISLAQAHGRILAQPIPARLTQPPADLSAMDGYALRAADEGARRVIGEAAAGHPFAGAIGPGEAVRLFTGSVVPRGADAVLLQEDAATDAGVLRPTAPPRAGQHIRRRGQDFFIGDTLLAAGRQLGARDIGLIAAANHPWVTVHRRPRIAILATGDELGFPGEPVVQGGIVSSNSLMLAALTAGAGAEPLMLPVAPDNRDSIAAQIAQAGQLDVLVTVGGASVGDHDLVRPALEQAGATLDFWKIAMRPGKPMMSGALGPALVIGLPGNPVSAFVCGVLFLLPALRRMAGWKETGPFPESAHAGAPMRENDRRADHLRARLSHGPGGELVATPFERQDSSLLRVLAEAGALILRPPHAPAVAAGERVEIIRL